MFGKFQRFLTGLLAMLAVVAQAHDRYLQVAGPVPLRFQEPAKPAPPPLPLPPPAQVEQPPMPKEEPAVPPVTTESPVSTPGVSGTSEPLGPQAPQTATPLNAGMVLDPITGAASAPNQSGALMQPLTPQDETVSPQALMGLIGPRRLGPGRNAGAAVVLPATVFTPAQPAATQPSSATYTVK